MSAESLKSLQNYCAFIAEILERPSIKSSNLTAWSASPYTGVAEGEVILLGEFRLRLREELDFEDGLITSYGYEVYQGDERLYWYDDFPHPNEPTLVSSYPHHKPIPPDIKHHRIPAPEISFDHPNLSYLLQEIEALAR